MAPKISFLLVATAILGVEFLIEHGNRTRIAAPDQPDRAATFVGTPNGANRPREPGGRMIHSGHDPLF